MEQDHYIAEWAAYLELTQNDISRLTGVDKATVSRWFNGKTAPQAKTRRRLAVALHISPNQLLSPPPIGQFEGRIDLSTGDVSKASVEELYGIAAGNVDRWLLKQKARVTLEKRDEMILAEADRIAMLLRGNVLTH